MKPVIYRNLSIQDKRKVRESYVEHQKGLCWYCDQPLNSLASSKVLNARINKSLFPTGFFNYPVHLHHDHNTGLTIGAVHNVCNAYLWQYLGE